MSSTGRNKMPKPKPAKRFKKDGLRVFVYAQNKSPGGLGSKSTKAKTEEKKCRTVRPS